MTLEHHEGLRALQTVPAHQTPSHPRCGGGRVLSHLCDPCKHGEENFEHIGMRSHYVSPSSSILSSENTSEVQHLQDLCKA
jgi:hypothetical protein